MPAPQFLRWTLGSTILDEYWELNRKGEPVTLTGPPIGVDGPIFENIVDAGARERGVTYRGTNMNGNRVILPVRLRAHKGDYFRDVWGRWRRALGSPETPSRLYAISSLTGYRWLDVRLDQQISPQHPPKWQFGDLGRLDEEVTLMSERALWSGFPTYRTWYPSQFGTAQTLNIGDIESWPKITLVGPGRYRVGIGPTESLPMPLLASGEQLVIQTDIENQWIRNQYGVDQGARVGLVWFNEPIPPGPVPCKIRIEGTGFNPAESRVHMEIPHDYYRAVA